jgi:DNA polymerase-3 subunit epsilon
VYVFKDRSDNVLYVGKATDLRSRVRSYFSTDDRRKVAELLRSTATIDHEVSVHPLAAAVREVQLIAAHLPRFNSQATRWRAMAYVVLSDEAFPRLKAVRTPPPPGSAYLGPLSSLSAAHRVIDAVTTVVPLRRCSANVSAATFGQLDLDGIGGRRPAPCAPAQLGVACCPCTGEVSPTEYAQYCEVVERGFTDEPDVLLGPLRTRMGALAAMQRFEQAAEVRDRAATLAEAIRRRRRLEAWRAPERVVAEHRDGSGAEIVHGRLGRVWAPGDRPRTPAATSPAPRGAVPREETYERLCIVTELERARSPWRLIEVDGTLAEPIGRIDRFTVPGSPDRRRDQ